MTDKHSSKQYDDDLEALRSNVLLMGGLVENQLYDAVASFKAGNREAASRVMEADASVHQLEIDLDDACRRLVVQRQPAANDLRTVMSTGKIITELARIGEEAGQIARIAQGKNSQPDALLLNGHESVRDLASQVGNMVHDALDALSRLDEKQAVKLITKNAEMNEEFRAVMRNLITAMTEDPHKISAAVDTMWIAKAIARIGDHAKNMAEHIIFIVEGQDIRYTDYAARLRSDFE